jgi:hypothetical protein
MTDNLDKLIAGATSEVRTSAKPTEFKEKCTSCGGLGCWNGRPGYPCFKCNGTGYRTFKQPAEKRAQKRAAAVQKKVNAEEASIEAFKAANPAEYAWLVKSSPNFQFASDMLANIRKWGSLTANQLAACTKAVEKIAAKNASAPTADQAGIDRLKLAFDTAIANASAKGLNMRTPKITIGGMKISPAKANSTNPGALYVNGADREYLGKIKDGKFMAASACSPDQQKQILAFVADPKAAAEAYGQTTGVCCICNATLISKWKHRGIGPVCATRFGW